MSAYRARLGMVVVTERWKDRDKQKKTQTNAQHSSGFTGKCRGGVEKEPGPRRALVARMGFLEGRDSEGTQTSTTSARLGMVAVMERWGGLR